MSESSTLIGYEGRTILREALALVPTPVGTETHRPIPHQEVVQALIETLGFRHIGVVHDEYAVSPDGCACSESWLRVCGCKASAWSY